MFDQLENVVKHYEWINQELARPEVAINHEQSQKLIRELHGLEEIVATYRKYREVSSGLEEAREILETSKDTELLEMADREKDE